MNRHRLAALLMALMALAVCACAGVKPKSPPPPVVSPINAQTFPLAVTSGSGLALVLFYNDGYPQSREMMGRFQHLAAAFKGKAGFYSFSWDLNAPGGDYRLEMLPTLVMYRDGREVDRMRGIPSEAGFLDTLDDDLELWMLRTGLGLSQDMYHGSFSYRFNNTSRLNAGF